MEELIGTHNEYYLHMWITRNKRDTYEEDSLILWIEDEKPNRIENSSYQYWFGVCGVDLKLYNRRLYDQFKYLTWEDEPIEVFLKLDD